MKSESLISRIILLISIAGANPNDSKSDPNDPKQRVVDF